ncbi:TlpA family protein disulfide reductase [Winogradskyella sp. F6397]|uniref:TlpA family protein disulfide reductase n=1 Tax=Winogradskyella marina TaxID=2785530 RepID=A0ABS0EJV7_9FLAO|nr:MULTISPECIES: TlpA disulfide reductase family protein [Winogradskyella]MBF8150749.1 TlpA family protein disulfide reductase [Winogradskyella marina]
MKTNIALLLLFTLFLTSCGDNNQTKDYIVLSGTIDNASSTRFMLSGDNIKARDIELDENGSFLDTITSGEGRYILFDPRNRFDFYFTDGGEYNLTADLKDFKKTAKLTGTDVNASNYLFTKINNIKKVRGNYVKFNSLNESDFLARQAELHTQYVSYLDSFPNLPKTFEKFERQELENYNFLTLAKYPSLHRMYTKQPDFDVSADFYKKLESVDYLDEEAYNRGGSYEKLVTLHFNRKAEELAEKEDIDKYFAKLEVFGAIPNDTIKNSLLFSAANRDISYTDKIDDYYNTFISFSTDSEDKEKIKEKYDTVKKLAKGQPSPVFTDYVNHAGGTNSLSDFEGKYVYIDVWATWCAPCIKEIPSLKKVEKQYHDKNIEFLSISIDVEKAHDSWRKMVTSKELGGVQLLADEAWKSEFIKNYQISGIPRFILIGPDGNIVDANAPRPSSSKLISLFNELNI